MSDDTNKDEPAEDEIVEDAPEAGVAAAAGPDRNRPRVAVRLAWEAAVAKPVAIDPEAGALGDEESDRDASGEVEGGKDTADEIELDDADAADDDEDETQDENEGEDDEEGGGEDSEDEVDDELEADVVAAVGDEPVEAASIVKPPGAEDQVAVFEAIEDEPDAEEAEGAEYADVADEADESAKLVQPDEPDELVEPAESVPEHVGAAALSAAAGRRISRGAEPHTSIQYSKRNTRYDKQDRGWWVDGDYLFEADGSGREWRTHLGDVLEVQTAPAPARFRPWRHQTVLGLRNSRRIEIDNAHYVGTANYEERSARYAPFVRDLIAAIAEKAPYAKARRGASYLGYVGMMGFVVMLIGLVATLLFLLPIEGVPGIVWIKAGLVALMAPPLFAWVVSSRPKGMKLGDLPPGALPRARR